MDHGGEDENDNMERSPLLPFVMVTYMDVISQAHVL